MKLINVSKNKKLYLSIFSIVFIILNMQFSLAKTSHFYKLSLNYENGAIFSKSIEVKPYIRIEEPIYGDYSTEIISFNNTLLNRTYFDFSLEVYFDTVDETTGEINGGGIKILNQSEITLFLPYYKNAKEINIYDKEFNKALVIDVEDFSKSKSSYC